MSSEADEIVGLYQRHARSWAKDRGNWLIEGRWLERFRGLLPGEASILDVGCGSGEPIARYFIERGHGVTGVDSSAAMIEMCEGNFPGGDWRVMDMRTMSLGRVFSGILAWDSFFHLSPEDQGRMFPVFRKHAAARGVLMFTSGSEHGVAMGSYQDEPLYHASLDMAEYRELLAGAGFEVVEHVIEEPLEGGRTVWLAQLE
jgi:SAM-dependent methyltransferase